MEIAETLLNYNDLLVHYSSILRQRDIMGIKIIEFRAQIDHVLCITMGELQPNPSPWALVF